MSVHFDPTGGISVDLKSVIEAIRQENHQAIDRKVMQTGRLLTEAIRKSKKASKKVFWIL
jgi:hypothetical protein